MLIWQTWFQKPLKALSANVLGTKVVTGIYKITNRQTGECYVGQARDVASRWSDHAKCGLGIDTPANNKLYQAMEKYGLWSFSWELLEECPQEQLNEKEKFYIDLYDSYNYGMNSNKGVSK
jgi:group I intron endonuclease